jgi:hypothetical protein
MNPSAQPGERNFPLVPIVIATLAVATAAFAVLFVIYFSKNATATKTLTQAKREAVLAGAAQQKKLDAKATEIASESPFRRYDAPSQFGPFVIKFPKNWSARVAENANRTTQVNFSANPDFIRYKDDEPLAVALRVRLIQQNANAYVQNYDDAVKSGALKKSALTVSGQKATLLQGNYDDGSGTAAIVRLVAVPVRDKVIVFTCENSAYTTQFDTVVSQATIIP